MLIEPFGLELNNYQGKVYFFLCLDKYYKVSGVGCQVSAVRAESKVGLSTGRIIVNADALPAAASLLVVP